RTRHRARDRSRAGTDAAGHDDRLRRQPYQHSRRFWLAGVWDWHIGGRACAGNAVVGTAEAEDHADRRAVTTSRRSWREGSGAGDYRADWNRWRYGACDRVRRTGRARAFDGRPDDALHYERRGRSARWNDRTG